MTLPRGSGLTCSSNRANKTAKKLIAVDHTGGVARDRIASDARQPADAVSGRQEAVEIAQHGRGGAPDEVAPWPPVGVGARPGDREKFAAHTIDVDGMP